MERWAKAAMSLSGMKVLWTGQTALRPSFARSAVAAGSTPNSTCAPRPGASSARRKRAASSVFVSRVSLNPRLTRCFSWPERGGCCGSAGRLPFNLWPLALLSACGEVEGPPRANLAQRNRILLPDRIGHCGIEPTKFPRPPTIHPRRRAKDAGNAWAMLESRVD